MKVDFQKVQQHLYESVVSLYFPEIITVSCL